MTSTFEMQGLIPAVFTPMHQDGSLHLAQVPALSEQLIAEGVGGFYVCGSTGEGPCLSREERMATAEAYLDAAKSRVPVIVQVGHQSIAEAQQLAAHAQQQGADAISAIPPNYFKPRTMRDLVDALADIAAVTPELPFYYYHIPAVTGVPLDMVQFLETAGEHIPNLVGAKFSHSVVNELQACLGVQDGRFDMLFGSDEMLLSALVVGVRGAVGSTYNFAVPLYRKIITAFEAGDIEEAKVWQAKAVEMVRVLVLHGANPAIKAMMTLLDLDCGPTRLPQRALSIQEISALKEDMTRIGFFDWGRS